MEEDQILVCEECGSRNVETQAWVKVNENDKCDGYLGLEDSGNNWCCDCEGHVDLTSLEEWEKHLDED